MTAAPVFWALELPAGPALQSRALQWGPLLFGRLGSRFGVLSCAGWPSGCECGLAPRLHNGWRRCTHAAAKFQGRKNQVSFKPSILFLMCALSFGASAFADDGHGKGPGGGDGNGDGGAPQVTRAMSWVDFKEACVHPSQFGSQRAPQNIKVMCTNSQTSWVASASGEVNLQSTRQVTVSVTSDKYHVAPAVMDVPVYAKVGSCARFKEVTEIYTAPERVVSCEEIMEFKGELGEFCAGELDKGKGANPRLVQTTETGRMIDTCGGVTNGVAPKEGGKPGV